MRHRLEAGALKRYIGKLVTRICPAQHHPEGGQILEMATPLRSSIGVNWRKYYTAMLAPWQTQRLRLMRKEAYEKGTVASSAL